MTLASLEQPSRQDDVMSAELLDEPELETEAQAGHLDPQLRPAASRDAHDLAPDPRARRRADHQGDARYRLPALGVREARRAPQLQPVRDGRRPQELHQPADERGRLAPRGREAAGYRADPAVPVHPGDHLASWRGSATTCSARAPRRSTWGRSPRSSYAFNLREQIYDVYEEMSGYRFHPGYTRVGGVLLRLQRPRARPDPARCSASFPRGLCRHGEAALPQPDLPGPAARRGRADARPTRSPLLHRADRPGQRRDLRPPQGRALPGLSRASTSRSPTPTEGDCWARFIVRMEEMRQSHQHHRAGRQASFPPDRSTCRSPRSFPCPTS